jgi:hypothetical protein
MAQYSSTQSILFTGYADKQQLLSFDKQLSFALVF